MLNLQKRIKGVDEDREYLGKRVNIRDKLLAQGEFKLILVFIHFLDDFHITNFTIFRD